MDKTQASSPSTTGSSSIIQEMSSSGTTLVKPQETVKTSQQPYPEYKPINSDNSRFYKSNTIRAEKLVFKLR